MNETLSHWWMRDGAGGVSLASTQRSMLYHIGKKYIMPG